MSPLSRKTKKSPLGKIELIAIALGGMIGGGIFSILGVSVDIVGVWTPAAIFIGGILALLAAYSYSKLAVYYKDEGATYSFFKKTFPQNPFAIATIGWLIVFGYISTLALYAYTFSSYLSSFLSLDTSTWTRLVALGVITIFAVINLISVSGMGKVEDVLVYTKVILLFIISGLFFKNRDSMPPWHDIATSFSFSKIMTVAAITFVAYEGFQLVIHAYEEAENPQTNIPSAIYWSIGGATAIYVILATASLMSIPQKLLIQGKEYALAAGARDIIGPAGYGLVILGALLATSSAINGTLFGASRLMAVIANDGVFPKFLAQRSRGHIPHNAIVSMSVISYLFILTGELQSIIEFGSITFILVSFLMAFANFKIHKKTKSHLLIALFAMVFLGLAAAFILFYEIKTNPIQIIYILGVYLLLAILAKLYSLNLADQNKNLSPTDHAK